MRKYLSALAALALLFVGGACTPEERNSGSEKNEGEKTVHVTGISLDCSNVTIKEGESVTLVATVKPDNAENKIVSWSSSDASVASVNNSGIVTGVKAGSATVTATTEDGGKTSSCVVLVEPNTALSVTVGVDKISAISAVLKGKANLGNTSSSDLTIGFQYSQSSGILPSNSTTVEVKDADSEYNYSASITGLEPGTTYYYRSFVREQGRDTYGETQEFRTKDLSSLLLTREATSLSAVSSKLNGTLDLTDVQCQKHTVGFYYGSNSGSLTEKATIGLESGEISAFISKLTPSSKYYYQAFVILDDKEFKGEVLSFSTKDISSLIQTSNVTNIAVNSACLNAYLDLTDVFYSSIAYGFYWGTSESNQDEFLSGGDIADNAYAATMGSLSSGKMYWYKAYVKLDSQVFHGEVRSFTTVVLVGRISFDKTSLSLIVGDEYTLTATVNPDNADNKTLKWTSSEESVATVDKSGKVKAKSKGTAVIKAEAQDGSGTYASCRVVVREPFVFSAVDLGLSVKWANANIGAGSEEDYGDYYAWGETQTKSNYGWVSYKWCMRSYKTLTKYCTNSSYGYNGFTDGKTVLDLEDDAASVNLGGKWRMPTEAEWTELQQNCTWAWTYDYSGTGVSGQIVTSKKTGYENKSIFLPAAGYRLNTFLYEHHSCGYYWYSSLYTDRPFNSWYVYFDPGDVRRSFHLDRCNGLPVRPVTE